MQRIKKVLLDPYCMATILFAVWMLFFDYQNVFVQFGLYQRLQKLQTDAADYKCQIRQIKKEKKELVDNIEFVEKVAREKYFMKRQHEDLYVIIEE